MRRVSVKRSAQLKEYYRLRLKFLKAHPICWVCKKGKSKDIHHSRGRAGALLNMTEHWIPVCRKDHNLIHFNVRLAQVLKLIAPKGSWGIATDSKPSMKSGGSEPMGDGA